MGAKKVAVDLDALEMALTDGSGMTRWYLDTHTGEVLMMDELPDEDLDQDAEEAEPLVEEAEADFDRYILIDPFPAWAEYRDMADFTGGVSDEHLRRLLDVALDGKGAFRRFKNALTDYPDVLEQWYRFRDQRRHERMLEWLEEIDLEPAE